MKKFFIKMIPLLFLGLLMLALTGCPYSSTVPLAEPNSRPDENMYGTWILDSTDEYPSYYVISEYTNTKFSLVKYSYDSDASDYYVESNYEAWFTEIGGTRFMNVEDVEAPGTFYFYKLEMDSDDFFILYEVTDNIDEVFYDSEEMYSFFRKYKDLSFFYNQGEETYLRAEIK